MKNLKYKGPKELVDLKKKYIVFTTGIVTDKFRPQKSKRYKANFIKFFDGRMSTQKIPFDRTAEINLISSDFLDRQVKFIELQKSCLKVGEIINDKLKKVLLSYTDCNNSFPRELVYKLNFENRIKKVVETLICDPIFSMINNIKDCSSQQHFSQIILKFFEDRNIYFGDLLIQIPDGGALILIRKHELNKPILFKLTDKTMQNYFNIYKFILDTLQQMNDRTDELYSVLNPEE